MTNIKSFIKKLRNAADTLEELFIFKENENHFVAEKILSRRGPYKKRKKLHWTQTPEGKRKISEAMKKHWKDKK